jgi:hypothetical protein
MKGVRSGPQALIAPLSAPKTPSGTAPGGTHLFRKGNQDARSLLDLTHDRAIETLPPRCPTCAGHHPPGSSRHTPTSTHVGESSMPWKRTQ